MQSSKGVDLITLHHAKPNSWRGRTAAMIKTSLHSLVLLLWGMSPANAAPPHGSNEPLDTLIRVGNHRLHFVVYRGNLPVTILLEAGGAADLTSWAGVAATLAQETGATVVAYDRAGLGRSEPGPATSTPDDELRDLHAALKQLKVPPKTILVAHSYGAMLSLLNAARYSEGLEGVVLVDPMNTRFIKATGDFIFSTVPKITSPSTDRERTITRMVATFPGLIRKVERLEPGLRQRMIVISAGKRWWGKADIDEAWRKSHEALAAAGAQRKLVIAEGSDHDVPEERPDVIVTAVKELLR
jgi:pimeloyl-ACP methyl ester carboxylesterase